MLKSWYNSYCLDEQNTRALCFNSTSRLPFHNLNNCGQSALHVRTHVLAVRLGNGGTHGGRFAMSGSKKHGETKEIVCPVCGKTFEKLLSFLRVHPQIHCSRKCMGISNASPERFVRTVCNACGKEFKKRRDHLTENNYCSRACAGKAKQVDGAKWKDPDQIKNYMKDYLSKNREQHNANSRKWRIENKAKRTHAQINRRSADKKGDFTLSQWEEMKNTYDHTCLNCGRKEPEIKLQPDHIVPVVFGGITTTDNIQPLCARCNKSKGANIIDYRARYPEIKFVEVMK